MPASDPPLAWIYSVTPNRLRTVARREPVNEGLPMQPSRRRRSSISVAGAAILVAGCQAGSLPFSGPSEIERTFVNAAQTWDLNRDNVVTCEEWKEYLTTSFREMDSDGDGTLSRDEFTKLAKQDHLFKEANYAFFAPKVDGKLTLAEMTGKPNPAFKRLDSNGDCRLVADEFVRQTAAKKGEEIDWLARQEGSKNAGR